jgi:NAD+ synthase (glutamine-hydrolysing)
MAVVLGFPEAAPGAPPPGVYNSAALLSGGRIAAVGRKSLLPTYDVFDETRYFVPAEAATAADAGALRLGLSICEDVWNDKRFWDRPRYARDPVAELARAGAARASPRSASGCSGRARGATASRSPT